MKKILITGSLGYIGSILTEYLTSNGYDCIGYDSGFFKDSLLYDATPCKTIYHDARIITEACLGDIDVVVHLAGISNDPMGSLNPAQIYDPTRDYAKEIARMCKFLGKKFIFASSCSVYGLGGDEFLDESSTLHPQTYYSLNKKQIEDDLKSLSDEQFSPIALRFATVFGLSPRIRFDVVINMLAGMAVADGKIVLNSNGKSWRPNLHILDACQAIMCAISSDYQGGDLLVLNVGHEDNNLQIIDIAKIIQDEVHGCEIKYLSQNPELDKDGLIGDRKVKNGDDVRTYKVSFEKIKQILPDFKCNWTVRDGVRDMTAKLKTIPLTSEMFKLRGFYRLQQLEYLHQNGCISDELYWKKSLEIL